MTVFCLQFGAEHILVLHYFIWTLGSILMLPLYKMSNLISNFIEQGIIRRGDLKFGLFRIFKNENCATLFVHYELSLASSLPAYIHRNGKILQL